MRRGICEGLAGSGGWCVRGEGVLFLGFSLVFFNLGVTVGVIGENKFWFLAVMCQLKCELKLRDVWTFSEWFL